MRPILKLANNVAVLVVGGRVFHKAGAALVPSGSIWLISQVGACRPRPLR